MFCTNCGKEIKPNDKFCANCGAPVNQGTQIKGKYDNVVFNPPFRKEADKKSGEILNTRGDFTKFTDLAQEENRRQQRSKNRMDWNLDGFPASSRVDNTPLFDWDAVAGRKKPAAPAPDLTSTMEHVRVTPEQEKSFGLPADDDRVVPLDELEKELFALEDDLKTETARTAEYDKTKVKDIDSSVELDSYLDGISPEGKKPEKASEVAAREKKAEKEAQAAAEAARKREEARYASMTKAERVIAAMKNDAGMRWNLQEPIHKEDVKAASSMGLDWNVDASDVAKKKKAEKLETGEKKMIWNLEEREAQRKAEEAARREAELRARMEAESARRAQEAAERRAREEAEAQARAKAEAERRAREEAEAAARAQAQAEAEALARAKAEAEAAEAARIQAEAEEMARQKAEEEARALAEAEERARQEAAAQAAAVMAEQEKRRQEEQARIAAELEAAREEASEKISSDVSMEFEELMKEAEPQGLGKTRVFDQEALDALNREAQERAEANNAKDLGAVAGAGALGAAAAGVILGASSEEKPAKPERSPYESDFVPAWEKEKEKEEGHVSTMTEEMARLDALLEELTSEKKHLQDEMKAEEPAPEVEPEVEPEVQPEPEEKPSVEELVKEDLTDRGDDRFYTFSRKNAEFQELLQKEKERLREMGSGYVPKNTLSQNAVLANFGVLPTLAHEENGMYVEGVTQPETPMTVDYSGYGTPNEGVAWMPAKGDDLLSELVTEVPSQAKKTRLRYSDLFPSEDVNHAAEEKRKAAAAAAAAAAATVAATTATHEPVEEAPKTETKERYQTATGIYKPVPDENAPDINDIFDEDENQKPKKHIIGNAIIILLVLLILFEASILAAKLIAPDSAYSKLTDPVIEKIMDFATSIGKDKEPEQESIDDEALKREAEAITFEQSIMELSEQATTIGEIKYNPDLTYDKVVNPHFDGIMDMIPLDNGLFTINQEGEAVTYGEAICSAVIAYYDAWQGENTDETYVGINTLEIGDIRTDGSNFYVLTRAIYAKNDGTTATSVRSCRLASSGDSMVLEEIGEEQFNG